MKFMNELDNFKYVLFFLTIIFGFLVLWGPHPEGGSLYPTAVLLLGLFGTLFVIYVILKVVQVQRARDNDSK